MFRVFYVLNQDKKYLMILPDLLPRDSIMPVFEQDEVLYSTVGLKFAKLERFNAIYLAIRLFNHIIKVNKGSYHKHLIEIGVEHDKTKEVIFELTGYTK